MNSHMILNPIRTIFASSGGGRVRSIRPGGYSQEGVCFCGRQYSRGAQNFLFGWIFGEYIEYTFGSEGGRSHGATESGIENS